MATNSLAHVRWLALALACVAQLSWLPSPALAATFVVDSTNDAVDLSPGDGLCASASGACTLRAAIQETNALAGSDEVLLPAGTYVLGIVGRSEGLAATGDLDITDDLSIQGAGADTTIVDGAVLDRIFDVADSATALIDGLRIQNGDLGLTGAFGEHGGGIRNRGTLTLTQVVISGNTAGIDFGIAGGLFNVGTLNLDRVSVLSNSAATTGGIGNFGNGHAILTQVVIADNTAFTGTGGMDNGEGVPEQNATAMLTNVTISGNLGGLCSTCGGGFGNQDTAVLTHVTISNNSGGAGGGIFIRFAGPTSPSTQLKNSIVANNLGINCSPTSSPILSLGNNLSSDDSCNVTSVGDLVNTDPLLGPLQDNGGFTRTQALLPGSPAIDAGSPDCPPPDTDQRGVARPQGVGCDIGAFELAPLDVAIDIRPFSAANTINLWSRSVTPVAILGSEHFDAADVDTATLAFAPGGAAPLNYLPDQLRDTNGDGYTDLISYYRTRDAGIAFGDTEACVTGATIDGVPFIGCDAIYVLGSCGGGSCRGAACGLGFELVLVLPPLLWWRRVQSRQALG